MQNVDILPTIDGKMSTVNLLDALLTKTRQAILRELVAAEGERVHLRELERRTGLNVKGVKRVLGELYSAGIVNAERSGNRIYYSINKRCPIYPELRLLVIKTVGLAGQLRDALALLVDKIDLAYIFGSFATGEEVAESDVDLMVVGEITLRDLSGALAQVVTELSREINPTVYSFQEYEQRLADRGSFVAQVDAGPKIMLIGTSSESG